MNDFTSPGSLVTIAGAALTVIGSIAYVTDSPNLSLAGVFYGVPVLLGGLALKSSELPPAEKLEAEPGARELGSLPAAESLRRLFKDVTRWRYGQKAHLETSLEALRLWDDEAPPELVAVRELARGGRYGLSLRFRMGGVPLGRWQDRSDRLGRFFAPGLMAEIHPKGADGLDLDLLPLPDSPPSEP
ncbi:DUF2854 domain-containing protein [Cyanobium sp. Morenito 9A2]|uniref:DUF2854 domain-containing protein n=1 Tax=Cyanobium sp. Morenito 9A2 TaxID=2823718 RepID=UPI0020CBA82B|nr:DUF2854 domain-containing protein [Cyanobium sp. Morenito 9A2]MCP9849345.1 DUF2854 domain-containing protein [Cyanobium sp. Morenito 9A2]